MSVALGNCRWMLLTLHKGFNKSPVRVSTLNERIRDNQKRWKVIQIIERIKSHCNYDHVALILTQILSFGFCHINSFQYFIDEINTATIILATTQGIVKETDNLKGV